MSSAVKIIQQDKMTITSIKLVSPSGGLPIITGVHDLLSGRHDGTITPWAPIIVSGSRLDIYALDKVHLSWSLWLIETG